MCDNFQLAPAEWTTLRRLLDQALELAPAARAAWVDGLDAQFEPFKPRLRRLPT